MDFQPLSILTALAGFFAGALLCWLVLQRRAGNSSAAHFVADVAMHSIQNIESHDELRAELAMAQQDASVLAARQQQEAASLEAMAHALATTQQALQQAQALLTSRDAEAGGLQAQLHAAQTTEKAMQQALHKVLARADASDSAGAEKTANLAALAAEKQAISQQLAEQTSQLQQLQQLQRDAAIRTEKASELPVLESEVQQLQALAKQIHNEFGVLQGIQRNFTAASAALQAVS